MPTSLSFSDFSLGNIDVKGQGITSNLLWNIRGEIKGIRSDNKVTSVPEPTTIAIFALGIMGLASRRMKKQ